MIKRISAAAVVMFCSVGLTACSDWRTLEPTGDSSFELPEPVSTPAREGFKLYESKFEHGKATIQVGFYPRANLEVDPGMSDSDILNKYEKIWIGQIQDNLTKGGMESELEYVSDLPVEGGLGQHLKIIVGNQLITTLFYLTPRGLYFVKIDNADISNPIVKRFMDSMNP